VDALDVGGDVDEFEFGLLLFGVGGYFAALDFVERDFFWEGGGEHGGNGGLDSGFEAVVGSGLFGGFRFSDLSLFLGVLGFFGLPGFAVFLSW
jgi:hypothetical protein